MDPLLGLEAGEGPQVAGAVGNLAGFRSPSSIDSEVSLACVARISEVGERHARRGLMNSADEVPHFAVEQPQGSREIWCGRLAVWGCQPMPLTSFGASNWRGHGLTAKRNVPTW